MSRQQTGRGSGLTGIVDLSGYSAKFVMNIGGWKVRSAGGTRPRRGRGGGVYRTLRWIFSSGNGWATGTINHADAAWPAPDEWKGQTGTITVKVATGKTVAYPILISEAGFDFKGSDDEPNTYIAWEVTGAPTYTGWTSSQPGATDPSKADQEQWGGRKTIDPNGIQTSATRTIDIWGTLTDTDAAEQTKLLAVIAAAAPPLSTPHNTKLRTSTFTRDALDGGSINEAWGLTDTAEDLINAASSETQDYSGLHASAATAAINDSPPAPDNSELVHRFLRIDEINDSVNLHVVNWGQTTTQQDWEFPRTIRSDDLSSIPIRSYRTEGHVTTSTTPSNPTPAAGFKLRSRDQHQLTDSGYIGHHFEMGLTTIQEDIENGSSVIHTSASGFGSYETHGRVVATAGTADPGGTPSGLQLYESTTRELNDGAFHRIFVYKALTPAEEIEHRGTYAAASAENPAGVANSVTVTGTCSSGTDVASLAATLQTTYRNTAGFDSLSVTKIDKTHYQARIIFENDDLQLIEVGAQTRTEHLGVLDGGTSGAVKVSHRKEVNDGAGRWRVWLAPFAVPVATATVILRRRKTGINNADDVRSLAGRGSVNNATFLGYPSGTLMFMGAHQRTNWGLEGTNHTQAWDLVFYYRSVGHFDDGIVPLGGDGVLTDFDADAGDTPALNQINSGWIADSAVAADFSPFLS